MKYCSNDVFMRPFHSYHNRGPYYAWLKSTTKELNKYNKSTKYFIHYQYVLKTAHFHSWNFPNQFSIIEQLRTCPACSFVICLWVFATLLCIKCIKPCPSVAASRDPVLMVWGCVCVHRIVLSRVYNFFQKGETSNSELNGKKLALPWYIHTQKAFLIKWHIYIILWCIYSK